ncbi:hypothetical protein HY086_04835 [Candidatus Gottesmanbacteria bacterium]|nr:hypothetical protein [Candidatus Gottesmanbacteria bacterium]
MLNSESLSFVRHCPDIARDYLLLKFNRSRGEFSQEEDCSAHMSLVLSTWRKDAGVSFDHLAGSGGDKIWSLLRYWINGYDDGLDDDKSRFPSSGELKRFPLRSGRDMSAITSRLVETVNNTARGRDIIKQLAEFRRYQWDVNQNLFMAVSQGDITGIEKLKLESSGNIMETMVQIMDLVTGVDLKMSPCLEKSSYYYGRAGQWVDDLADFTKDRGDQVNLFVNTARRFPSEYQDMKQANFSRKSLTRATMTQNHFNEAFERDLEKVGDNNSLMKKSLVFFKENAWLYEVFESRSIV